MRIECSPAGTGSGEQWVRERFATEVKAYRTRSARAETALIAIIDADRLTVNERLAQLDLILDESEASPIRSDAEQIARLVPKRNVQTWILCLNDVSVDETSDYKGSRNDWTKLVRVGSQTLYNWTRANAYLPVDCISSLRLGVEELRRLDLRRS